MATLSQEGFTREVHPLPEAILDERYIPLSVAAMREVGSAAQTLGGMYDTFGHETFVPKDEIAGTARVPIATFWRHVALLKRTGWIETLGRQRLSSGWLRRTSTLRLTDRAIQEKRPFLRLPWWAAERFHHRSLATSIDLAWSSRALLAFVASHACKLWEIAEKQENELLLRYCGADESYYRNEQLMLVIETLAERFVLSTSRLARETGLSNRAVSLAKGELARIGFIVRRPPPSAGGTECLMLNRRFGLVTAYDDEGRVRGLAVRDDLDDLAQD